MNQPIANVLGQIGQQAVQTMQAYPVVVTSYDIGSNLADVVILNSSGGIISGVPVNQACAPYIVPGVNGVVIFTEANNIQGSMLIGIISPNATFKLNTTGGINLNNGAFVVDEFGNLTLDNPSGSTNIILYNNGIPTIQIKS